MILKHTSQEVMISLRIELETVNEWLKPNKLTLNIPKTKYVIFGSKYNLRNKPDLNLTLGGEKIDQDTEMKYLGVILDDHLTFNQHVQNIHTKPTRKLGIVRRANTCIEKLPLYCIKAWSYRIQIIVVSYISTLLNPI